MSVSKIVTETVKYHLELSEVDENTVIFGKESELDSLGLVSLLVDIEEKVFDEMGKEIVIASDRAMSQSRSPFSTVETLSNFVTILVEE